MKVKMEYRTATEHGTIIFCGEDAVEKAEELGRKVTEAGGGAYESEVTEDTEEFLWELGLWGDWEEDEIIE